MNAITVKDHSIDTMTKYKAMDPHHLQVLIDLRKLKVLI